jgi:hypothetical protein
LLCWWVEGLRCTLVRRSWSVCVTRLGGVSTPEPVWLEGASVLGHGEVGVTWLAAFITYLTVMARALNIGSDGFCGSLTRPDS